MISTFVRMLSLTLLPLLAFAQTAEQPQARVARLEHALCCYTESVAIHQSEIAVKMRLEIAKWVAAGRSDQEILDTYAGLYGSKVLADPRTMPRGWTPLLKRWRAAPRTAAALSATEVMNLPDFDDE